MGHLWVHPQGRELSCTKSDLPLRIVHINWLVKKLAWSFSPLPRFRVSLKSYPRFSFSIDFNTFIIVPELLLPFHSLCPFLSLRCGSQGPLQLTFCMQISTSEPGSQETNLMTLTWPTSPHYQITEPELECKFPALVSTPICHLAGGPLNGDLYIHIFCH